jgi:hypothetical protein
MGLRSSHPAIFPNRYSHNRWYRNWGHVNTIVALAENLDAVLQDRSELRETIDSR